MENNPLKTLCSFLNEQVYPKMKKKDVIQVKLPLNLELMKFRDQIKENNNLAMKQEIKILKKNMEELKDRLRKYESRDDVGYGKGRYCGD